MVKHRVLLADDHQEFRAAVRALLTRDQGIEVVAEARDGLEAVELARSTRPDVVVLDQRMPGLSGIEVVRQLVATRPSIKIIVCSVDGEQIVAAELLRCGASDCVGKDDAETLPQVIHEVMSRQ